MGFSVQKELEGLDLSRSSTENFFSLFFCIAYDQFVFQV